MFKKYPQFSFAFAIIFFSELLAIVNDMMWLRYLTKPLITISLMLFIWFTLRRKGRFTNKIIAGLFFSLLGDVFLMFTQLDEIYFMLGLGAFMIAHLFYIGAFYVDCTNKIEVSKRYVLPIFLVFGFVCMTYYTVLRPYLGNMKFPVLFYSFAITLMAITAALRYGKTNTKSFAWILLGALMFLLSDSILAYNKFVERIEIGDLLIMITYMLAQFLIAMGTVERKYIKMN
ncbi:lysoplasmalogenase [Pedobacter sp. ASV28]|uniref:lysoplasmalogenase n=1 Tax=Pedobacter sp. ASV28 TaxID=2795123 RepID=UPI0018EC0C62|nr:lysoplasmalogenase [Pedobacter sp. ASV28]